MLVEMCCKCGFVHRDDRITPRYRAYKPHYHWMPPDGERTEGEVTFHATVCAACCDDTLNWKEFCEQKAKTPEKYRVQWSLNAPLPDRLFAWASALYAAQINC